MLRTKQLSTLSQCARSFYISGSKYGGSDGASHTCTEDEKHVYRNQSHTGFQPKQKTFHATFDSAAKAGSPCVQNDVGSISPCNCENSGPSSYFVSAPQILHATSTLGPDFVIVHGKVNSVNDEVHASQKGLIRPPMVTAERFIKAGIASVGIFPELINYKIPVTNGQDGFVNQNSMVDSTRSSPNISSYGKSNNRSTYSKLQPNLATNIEVGSNSNFVADSNPGNKAMKAGSVKSIQSDPQASTVAHGLTSDSPNQKQYTSQRENSNHDAVASGISNFHSSNIMPQKAELHSDGGMSPTGNSDISVPGSLKFYPDGIMSDATSEGTISERKDTSRTAEKYGPASKLQRPTRSVRLRRGAQASNRSMRTIELYYHTLQQLPWGPAAEAALDSIHHKLDAFQANQVLKLLHDHSIALGFFKWLKSRAGFKHDEHTYTTMIGILGHARQFGVIKRLLEEMISSGCHPTVVTYNRLIHAYGRANYIGNAVEVFRQMQEAGYEPDRVTYCTLIDIHAKAGYLDLALDLYQRMQEVGLSPDTFTYSAMVNCLGKGGHLAAAYKLFCEMIEQGCVPNLVTYNIMIALQAKARNYSCAVKLYRDMQAAGFRPDKITYSIVMEVLGHCGHLDEVEAVFMEMQQDWVPDEPAYGLLVDMWGKAGNLDKAQAWYQSMLDAGLRPNVPTCNSLLSAFLKVHRFSDAYGMLLTMLELGLPPSLQTYTLLLSFCTEAHAQMGLCFNLMAITRHPAHMFLVSLPNAELGGQNVKEHTSSFFDLMHSEDRESKRGLVDAAVDFLWKSGYKEEAGLVWEVAADRNVYPDSVREKKSSYWLINLHVMSEGTAITALCRTLARFRRQMLSSGIGPCRVDIVTGWGRRSRITGSSLVRQSVQELLSAFQFPFFTSHGNSGCFVGCGEPLNKWLLNSYVESMHLL